MKFSDYKYERPDYEKVKAEMDRLIYEAKCCETLEMLLGKIDEINKLRLYYSTMRALAGTRFSQNMNAEFNIREHDYFNEYEPYYAALNADFYKMLLNSPFLPQLKKEYGEQFFTTIENYIKVRNESVIANKSEDNRLVSEVSKIKNAKKISFDGKEMNTVEIGRYMESNNRNIRKSAGDALNGHYAEIQNEIDSLYDKMVKLRDDRAKCLGYKNYEDVAYIELNRSDYNPSDVSKYRDYVHSYIVPFVNELMERQRQRTKINKLQYYDENFKFLTGNPMTRDEPDELLRKFNDIYSKISPQTGEYFQFMLKRELVDITTRDGKETGGFTDYIPGYKSPYVFCDLNGTSHDVTIIAHETGHGFQQYMSRNIKMLESCQPTLEMAETDALGMELLLHPYMDKFFGTEALKYKYLHIVNVLKFIPYGTAVDEFQHLVYAKPQATPTERRKMWRDTEKKYLPYRNYDDNPFLDSGTWWYRQGHIFFSPFYYIDYTLAQICALQFWQKMNKNKDEAWSDYIRFCSLGGTMSFNNLLKEANLKSPFDEDTIRETVSAAREYLNSIDDGKL